MGAFNTLITTLQCPHCKKNYEGRIQFKYGQTWQHIYKLGDQLEWGGLEVGIPGTPKVKAYGILENEICTHCDKTMPDEFDIYIFNDVLTRVETMEDYKGYFATDGDYIIL